MPRPIDLRRRILRAMKRGCISQLELSRRSGVPQPQISRHLSGRVTPTLDVVNAYLRALGLRELHWPGRDEGHDAGG